METLPTPILTEIFLQLSYVDLGNLFGLNHRSYQILQDEQFWRRKILLETDNYLIVIYKYYSKKIRLRQDGNPRLEYFKLTASKLKDYLPGIEKIEEPTQCLHRAFRTRDIDRIRRCISRLPPGYYDRSGSYYHESYWVAKYRQYEVIPLLNLDGKFDLPNLMRGYARSGQRAEFEKLFMKHYLSDNKPNDPNEDPVDANEDPVDANEDPDEDSSIYELETAVNNMEDSKKWIYKSIKGDATGSFFTYIYGCYKKLYDKCMPSLHSGANIGDLHYDIHFSSPLHVLTDSIYLAARVNRLNICSLIVEMAELEYGRGNHNMSQIYSNGLNGAAYGGHLDGIRYFIGLGADGYAYAIVKACRNEHRPVILELLDRPAVFTKDWPAGSVMSYACESNSRSLTTFLMTEFEKRGFLTRDVFVAGLGRCLIENYPTLFNFICDRVPAYDLEGILLQIYDSPYHQQYNRDMVLERAKRHHFVLRHDTPGN